MNALRMTYWLVLMLILLIGIGFRAYGIWWDQGLHLHPDERAIILHTLSLAPPLGIPDFFRADSPWNPDFFAYGSLPLYTLWVVSHSLGLVSSWYATYDGMLLAGRLTSIFWETMTIVLVAHIGKHLISPRAGLLAALGYSLSVLAIQSAHFYIVDISLTFWTLLTLWLAIRSHQTGNMRYALLAGVSLGCALATKTSATALIGAVGISLLMDLIVYVRNRSLGFTHYPSPTAIRKRCLQGVILGCAALFSFVILQPYAVIDWQNFLAQNLQQFAMTRDAFTFPYTLQYVGKIPYLHELTHLFWFGLGPVQAIGSIGGILLTTLWIFRRHSYTQWTGAVILLTFFWTYVAIVGSFAIGFMRYLLPVYPLFALGLAVFLHASSRRISDSVYRRAYTTGIIIALFIWPLSFVSLYSMPHTRIEASAWMHQTIPSGSSIAVEHWDDSLPLWGQERYRMITLELYNPDTPQKWNTINVQLNRTDYLVIASQRLWKPLTHLTDCSTLPPHRCYPITAAYYRDLFSESGNFRLIATFKRTPTVPFLGLPIDTASADESFSVYDHPTIWIFKRIAP